MKMNHLQDGPCILNDSVLEIPALNRWGYLPEGVHDACFEEVIKRFATNSIRNALCHRLEKFLLTAIDSKSYSYAYIGGEFTTGKPSPREIDLILQAHTKLGPSAFPAIKPFLKLGLDTIRKTYSVRLRFWSESSLEGVAPFGDYFQDVLPDRSNFITIAPKGKRGLIRVQL